MDLLTNENFIFYGSLSFVVGIFIWEEYLAWRQRCIYKSCTTVPAELEKVLGQEIYEKSRHYGLDKSWFSTISSTFSEILSMAALLLGLFPAAWGWSVQYSQNLGFSANSEVIHSVIFLLLTNTISTVIKLPWSAYYTFVLEEKHDFNKQTPWFFIKDHMKSFVVGQLISVPVLAAVIVIIQWGGDYFFIYLWVFVTILIFFLMTIYPEFIAPLFDKYTPLPEGPLRSKIEALASRISFPLYKLYIVEGSKRSAHSNAYMYGFFNNKRIVLFDTLVADYSPINEGDKEKKEVKEATEKGENEEKESEKEKGEKKGCQTEEVLAILGHELGHWKLNHVVKMLIISEVNVFLCFLSFAYLYQNEHIYSAFGFHDSRPLFVGLIIVMQFILNPYNTVLGFLAILLSRHHEFQADSFAKSLGYASQLRSGLIKIHKDNLQFPVFDWLFSTWHHSHPSLLHRMVALDKTD